jgi:hypothetical protein
MVMIKVDVGRGPSMSARPTTTIARNDRVRSRLRLADQFDAALGTTIDLVADPAELRGLDLHAIDDLDGRGDHARLADLIDLEPADERDALLTLLSIYDLWMAPIATNRGREVLQNHPAVNAVKWRLEGDFVSRLDERRPNEPAPADAVAAMRRIAAIDLVPAVYDWLESAATWDELVRFLAIEGGPDAGFDDLVAMAQVGIRNIPKVALATNYWDELGRGNIEDVHTVLHDNLVAAIEMPRVPRADLPLGALERIALGGMLATNRSLQPEMLGALGLLELQAGPRCRAVVRALTRLGAPRGAFPFYEEHATADPRHGKDWLDRVVAPLAAEDPAWASGIVRGGHWRHAVNARFFADALDHVQGRAHTARCQPRATPA